MQIADRCVVSLEYRLSNDRGELLDSSPAGEPLDYLHGAEGILPLLEQALAGRSAGERFDITITPEEGFGEREARLIEVVPRAAIAHADQITLGMQVDREGDATDGTPPRRYVVTALDETTVTLDANHPLAGQTLRFEGQVVAVRAATAEELGED
ncbi:FKBP-type peptidyl-prolyl cis-trans isomerase SlyD [Gammaproteobacteria bacterium]|nr:peptidylprolyl isomerase [Gammaproteobacteria bacterium]MCL4776403.1 peptidylprolyl isomerase [Gammaproteobacteria bacterium]QOJ32032.1 MAG: peptidylprolyl isomerase [Gammaproteobacteria bacterium]CAG0938011.1 FKBP-type peptidyl-prolyl cis-trans isomerase SlyD [Gammaproteobacteria bacterium]